MGEFVETDLFKIKTKRFMFDEWVLSIPSFSYDEMFEKVKRKYGDNDIKNQEKEKDKIYTEHLMEYIKYILSEFYPQPIIKAMTTIKKCVMYWKRAFTHSSFLPDSYETLETIGDAYLKGAFTPYLYDKNPNITPESITNMNTFYMSKMYQPTIARKFKMDKYIRINEMLLNDSVLEDVFEAFMAALVENANVATKYFALQASRNTAKEAAYKDAMYAVECKHGSIAKLFLKFYFDNITIDTMNEKFPRKTFMMEYRHVINMADTVTPFKVMKHKDDDILYYTIQITQDFIKKFEEFEKNTITFKKNDLTAEVDEEKKRQLDQGPDYQGSDDFITFESDEEDSFKNKSKKPTINIYYAGATEEDAFIKMYNAFNKVGVGKNWVVNKRDFINIVKQNERVKAKMSAEQYKKISLSFVETKDAPVSLIQASDPDQERKFKIKPKTTFVATIFFIGTLPESQCARVSGSAHSKKAAVETAISNFLNDINVTLYYNI